MRGVIALDIDGTITTAHEHVPKATVAYLAARVAEGWHLVFITGRPFSHVARLLGGLDFPFHVAPQNGAALLEMPGGRVIDKRCLGKEYLEPLDRLCRKESTSFAVYAGPEAGDQVFWCPTLWPETLRDYLERRKSSLGEHWVALESFEQLPVDSFTSVKCIAPLKCAEKLGRAMEKDLGLHAPVIDDPFDPNYYVAQGTHPEVNKGQALRNFAALTGCEGPWIAAGDNANDLALLAAAHVGVAMADAPLDLKRLADIIAPPADEEGILQGLEEAIEKCPEKSL